MDGKNITELDNLSVRVMAQKLEASGISVDSIGSPLGKIKITDDCAPKIMDKTRR